MDLAGRGKREYLDRAVRIELCEFRVRRRGKNAPVGGDRHIAARERNRPFEGARRYVVVDDAPRRGGDRHAPRAAGDRKRSAVAERPRTAWRRLVRQHAEKRAGEPVT